MVSEGKMKRGKEGLGQDNGMNGQRLSLSRMSVFSVTVASWTRRLANQNNRILLPNETPACLNGRR